MSSSVHHEIEFDNDSCYSLESSFSSYDSSSDNILFADNTSPNAFTNSSTSNINPCFEIKNPYHKRYHHQQHLNRLRTPSIHDRGCLSDHEKQHLGGINRRTIAGSSSCFNLISSPRAFSRLKLWFGSFPFAANQNNLSSVHAPTDCIKRKMIGQQKKEELEREVYVLHKMLAHEEKVHQYLERQHSSATNVPNFLPPKVKELLAELSMVENEIARIETQISQLQLEVQREKEATRKLANLSAFTEKSSDRVAFETKAFHYINKPMKRDYSLSDLSFSENRQNPNGFAIPREDDFREDRFGDSGDKALKRSGIMKSTFPLRETIMHPTCRRDRNNLDPLTGLPPRSLLVATPLHSERERIQRWTPNKLSENIMKCLISIYMRLLRTSKAMELERSGPIARSRNFFFSFRSAETSPSKMIQKGSEQQDPYGIFIDSEDSIRRDIGPYKNLVRFTSSAMHTKCIQNSSSLRLFQKLKVLMDVLEKVDLRFLSHQQKIAFWINMHNACIMHGFLQYGVPPVFSHENMLALTNKATLNIAGNTINAREIERFILRKPEDLLMKEVLNKGDVGSKQKLIGEIYGLETHEPNITFALCCGTRSSPSVKIYTAEGVTSELEKSKLEYLQAAIIVTGTKQISIPELLLGNMNDFARDTDTLIEWLCHQLPTSGSLRKSIVDCFRGSVHANNNNKTASAVVEKTPYDFEFQYLLSV